MPLSLQSLTKLGLWILILVTQMSSTDFVKMHESSDGLSSSISFANFFFHTDDNLQKLRGETVPHWLSPWIFRPDNPPPLLPPPLHYTGPLRLEVRRRHHATGTWERAMYPSSWGTLDSRIHYSFLGKSSNLKKFPHFKHHFLKSGTLTSLKMWIYSARKESILTTT